MRAVVVEQLGGLQTFTLTDLPEPCPAPVKLWFASPAAKAPA
jgi:hypothetical protein